MMGNGLSGFSFSLKSSEHGAAEGSNPEMSEGSDSKSPQMTSLSSWRSKQEAAWQDGKLLENNRYS